MVDGSSYGDATAMVKFIEFFLVEPIMFQC